METKRFVIFTGLWPAGNFPKLSREDFIACADAGYLVCKSAGAKPDIVIGDFDSLPEALSDEIEGLGIERIIHPHEKDDTDTMLCAKYGIALGFEKFLIVGGIGGDFRHTIANVQTLSFLMDMDCSAELISGMEKLFMADGETLTLFRDPKPAVPVEFTGAPGTKFSVFSFSERSSGVYVQNSKYELSDAVLTQSYPVGVSNEFIGTEPVTVSVSHGRLLIITEYNQA